MLLLMQEPFGMNCSNVIQMCYNKPWENLWGTEIPHVIPECIVIMCVTNGSMLYYVNSMEGTALHLFLFGSAFIMNECLPRLIRILHEHSRRRAIAPPPPLVLPKSLVCQRAWKITGWQISCASPTVKPSACKSKTKEQREQREVSAIPFRDAAAPFKAQSMPFDNAY